MTEKEIKYKFCHTADWHLDYYQYQKRERWEDFIKAANDCSKLMLKEKPNFVIHCGDFFHNFKPSAGAIRFAIRILDKFKEANIPFYVIRGNHDASKAQAQRFGGTILKFLDELEYLHYIEDETINVNKDINITGIGEYGKTTSQRLEEVLRNNPLDKSKFNILMLHGYLQGQVSDSIYDVSGYQLASMGFDYIGLGHYHKNWTEKENNIYCPGSTEQTSLNDWGKPEEDGFFRKSSFYRISIKKESTNNNEWSLNVKRKKFNVRPKGRFVFNFENDTPIEKIKKQADDFITNHDLKGAIIRYDFIGELPLGKQVLLNFNNLPSINKSKALYLKINPQISKIQLRSAKPNLSTDEALIELFDKTYKFSKESSGKWLDLVSETVKILGKKTISSEKAEEINTIYELISDVSKNIKESDLKKKKQRKTKKSDAKESKQASTIRNQKAEQSNLTSFLKEEESN